MKAELIARLRLLISTPHTFIEAIEGLHVLKNEGFTQTEVVNALEKIREECKTEVEEDCVLDLLDFATGYCQPDRKVF